MPCVIPARTRPTTSNPSYRKPPRALSPSSALLTWPTSSLTLLVARSHLYPSLVEGYEWWAWADLDVIFGDLLGHMERASRHPACCAGLEVACTKKARRDRHSNCYNSSRPMQAADTFWNPSGVCICRQGESINALSPLYPNPWRKKCWGPFTAFKQAPLGRDVFQQTARWKDIIAEPAYVHSDEWWGPFAGKGFETMGEIMTRLSDQGSLVMSKSLLPFSEAKSCADIECTFCPCGATRARLDGRGLLVNEQPSMVLHLAQSKPRWFRHNVSIAASLPAYSSRRPLPCLEVEGLGALAADDALALAGELPRSSTRYARHRPVNPKAAACIEYEMSHPVPLNVRECEDAEKPKPAPRPTERGGAGEAGRGVFEGLS